MRVDTAWLLGNFVGLIIWGVYSTLFFLTMWMVLNKGTRNLRSPAILGVVAMYILSLVPTVLFIVTSYDALIAADGDAIAYLTGPAGYKIIAVTDVVMFLSMVIADLTLIWRLNIIYLGNRRVLIPVLVILLGTIVTGIGMLILDMMIVAYGPIPPYARLNLQFEMALVIFSLGFNWAVTALIVAELWSADKRMKDTSFLSQCDGTGTTPVTQMYQKVISGLIESGAIYSAVMVVFLVTYALGEHPHECAGNAQVFLIPITSRMIALIPTLIVLQRSLGYIQTSEAQRSPIDPISIVEFAVVTSRPCSTVFLDVDYDDKTSTTTASIKYELRPAMA